MHRIVPPQHGAWGFLVLPVVLGLAAGGVTWASVPVVLAWVALYPFSWALTNRMVSPRPERFDPALRLWAVVAVPLLIAAVVVHPWILWVGSAYALPFAGNVLFASVRRERSLANDVLLILECSAAVPVVAGLAAGSGSWSVPWEAILTGDVASMTATCFATLVGSTLHVRSLIRERSNPRFTTVSRIFAVACVPAVLVTGWAAGWSTTTTLWLTIPFAALAARACWLHDPTWRPARIGAVELGAFVLVAACSVLALA